MADDRPDYYNRLCPKCNHAMVYLAGWLADDSPGDDDTGYNSEGYSPWVSDRGSSWDLIDFLFELGRYMVRHLRLKPIVRKFPHAMYCDRCGYLQRAGPEPRPRMSGK